MKYGTLMLGLAILMVAVAAAEAEQLNCKGIILEPGINDNKLKLTTILNWPDRQTGQFNLVWKRNKYGTVEVWLNGKRCEIPE